MKQYEVWWADLPLPAGRRPVLLLSRNSAYAVRERILVAEITATIRNMPFEVPIGTAEGLPKRCVVNLDAVAIISKPRLSSCIGALPGRKVADVKRALGYALDWPELKAL